MNKNITKRKLFLKCVKELPLHITLKEFIDIFNEIFEKNYNERNTIYYYFKRIKNKILVK